MLLVISVTSPGLCRSQDKRRLVGEGNEFWDAIAQNLR